jgi:hypothetical protein
MGIYNRILNWRKFQDRTTALEIAFKQYQVDQKNSIDKITEMFGNYLRTCEACKAEVRAHHELDTKHVTADLRAQIGSMASAIARIESKLMEGPR